MDRSEILDVVCKHFRANVTIPDDVEIDPGGTMLDQGASSLDIVEITSGAMLELGVRIPRTQLARLNNIDELVDALHEAKSASA